MKQIFTCFLIIISLAGFSQAREKLIINFDFNKSQITAVAKEKLDSFIKTNLLTSIQKINLYGHCDAIGNDLYNDRLSVKRVEEVKEYLLAQNIPQNVFDTLKGFGKREPLNNNTDDEERSLNRRVEIYIERNEQQKPLNELKKEITKKEQTLSEKIKDTATKTGTNIILRNINFYGGLHRLMPQSYPVLKELLQTMEQNPEIKIEIQGHICCEYGPQEGFDEETRTRNLSVNRAKAIYDYLIQNNINPQRLSYKGFGHQFPLYDEDNEEHKLLNRRVEIKIIEK